MAFDSTELSQQSQNFAGSRFSSTIDQEVELAGSSIFIYRNSMGDDVTEPGYFNAAYPTLVSSDLLWVVDGGAVANGGTLYTTNVTLDPMNVELIPVIGGGSGGGVNSVTGGDNVTVSGTASDPVINVPSLGVETITAGTNVTVDDTDPANPIVNASGSGGASTFLELTDTPADYTGSEQLAPVVNVAEDGLEFGANLFNGISAQINFATGASGGANILNNAVGPVSLGNSIAGQINAMNGADDISLANSRNGELIAFDYAWPVGSAVGVLTNDGTGNLSWAAGGGGDLQSTLDLGDTATVDGTSNQLGITYTGTEYDGILTVAGGTAFFAVNNGSDGTQISSTDTDATLNWSDPVAGTSSTVSATDDGINLITDSGPITLNYAQWPAADGTAGQVLSTNADGTTDWITVSGGGTLQDLQSVLEEGSHALIEIPEGSASITYDDGTSASSVFLIDSGNIQSETTNTLTPSVQGVDVSPLSARLYYSNTSTEQSSSVIVSADGIDISPGTGPLTLDYTNWPSADGPADSVLMTDGAGQTSWSTIPAALSTDPLNPPIIARYRARFSSPGTQTIASSTGSEALIFGEELEDTAGISSDGTTFTAPPGTTAVEIKAQATWNSNGNAGLRQIFLWHNGGFAEQQVGDRDTGVSTSLNQRNLFSSPRLPCSAGDTFQIRANQNSSANANVTSENNATWVELEFYG